MEDIILNDKNKYNKIYTDLMFCVDDLRKMLDSEELNKRSFIKIVDILKDYMEFLDNIEKEISKSITSVLKIASISIDESTENGFIFHLEEVSANKILIGNLKLTVKFTGNAGFTERELN